MFVTTQALTPPARGGFSGDHLQVKIKCLPLPHLKVCPPESTFPVPISWWEPRRDKATTGGRRAQTFRAGIEAVLDLALALLQTRGLQSDQGEQIELLKQHPSVSWGLGHPAGMGALPEPGRAALQGAFMPKVRQLEFWKQFQAFFEPPPEKQDLLPLN